MNATTVTNPSGPRLGPSAMIGAGTTSGRPRGIGFTVGVDLGVASRTKGPTFVPRTARVRRGVTSF